MRPCSRLLAVFAAAAVAALLSAASSAADVPTLVASVPRLSFGASVTLQGTGPATLAGQEVDLLSRACGFTEAVPVATSTVRADGTYAFNLQPTLNTAFLVQIGDTESAETSVGVTPLVKLSRISSKVYRVNVSVGAGEFFSKRALLQSYDARKKTWRTLASGTLKQASDIGALIAVSAATVRATVPRGAKLRAYVPAATLGQCYLPTASAAITS